MILFRFGCFWFSGYCRSSFIERNAICFWIFLSSLFFPISLPLYEHCLDSKHFPYCAYVFRAVFGHLPSKCSNKVLHTEENDDLHFCYFHIFFRLQYSKIPWIWIGRYSGKNWIWPRIEGIYLEQSPKGWCYLAPKGFFKCHRG